MDRHCRIPNFRYPLLRWWEKFHQFRSISIAIDKTNLKNLKFWCGQNVFGIPIEIGQTNNKTK